jgi:hypothetical protein
LSLAEMQRKVIRLGSSEVAVSYPRALDSWFDGVVETQDENTTPSRWVRLSARSEPGRFDVAASIEVPPWASTGIELGEALAMFWERVSFLLVDDLKGAIAFHAAAARKDNCLIIIPGPSGTGKTHLCLWYRKQGFELLTDEIVAFERNGGSDLGFAGALAGPLLLKASSDVSPLLRPGEAPLAQQDSSYGLLLRLPGDLRCPRTTIDRGLIVFPSFNAGDPG